MSSETEDTLNDNLVDKTIVLLVEDNSDVREYIREALQENYYFDLYLFFAIINLF